MNRLNCEPLVARYILGTVLVAVVAVSMATAQTAPPATKPVVKPVAPARPVVVARPAAVKTTAGVVTPAAARTAMPTAPAQPATSTSSPAPSNFLTNPGVSNPAQQYVGGAPAQQYGGTSQATGSRSAVGTQGLGTFLWSDATLTVYACYRTVTRVLCDFDLSKQNNTQVNAPWVYGGVNMVDDGGKITGIHTAFFMGQDGSQFPTAYVTTTAVRMLMEYDNVGQNYTSVALVFGANRIQGVPIVTVDPSQPAGSVPVRGAASTSAPGAAAATAVSPIDGATNAVNNASNTVNTTKQKSKSLWDSLKSATTTTTTTK
jgi:hypothetical protein